MGIYQYTLRAPIKLFDQQPIGQFKFAYKHGWNWEAANKRFVNMMHSRGEDAMWKHKQAGTKLFVVGEWEYAALDGGLAIYELAEPISCFTEELRQKKIVGYLHKEGNKFRVNWIMPIDGSGNRL